MKQTMIVAAVAVLLVVGAVRSGSAQQAASDGPRYTNAGELIRPADYRGWIYLSTGLNMTYGADAPDPARNQPFNNVFVNRESYTRFLESGRWPDRTIFILEVRRSEQHVRPNAFGYTQAGVNLMEAAVKDSTKNGGQQPWAYYSFDNNGALRDSATPLPARAGCQACHSANTAVEQTFVQFYPTLFEVAKAKGTVKPTWNPALEITSH
ncbi:MAG TPA: cytochrome P460 family protein [Vicinamibacterales bacterium]|nr:cytochrome P460 family protein [Vicinamibacterales bacterium]